ncbi:MAG: hypothetical protein JNM88_20665 [Chitinophagaceae bacterium]|nr:hypothetical protein [Chitinophagaceae bacterium]
MWASKILVLVVLLINHSCQAQFGSFFRMAFGRMYSKAAQKTLAQEISAVTNWRLKIKTELEAQKLLKNNGLLIISSSKFIYDNPSSNRVLHDILIGKIKPTENNISDLIFFKTREELEFFELLQKNNLISYWTLSHYNDFSSTILALYKAGDLTEILKSNPKFRKILEQEYVENALLQTGLLNNPATKKELKYSLLILQKANYINLTGQPDPETMKIIANYVYIPGKRLSTYRTTDELVRIISIRQNLKKDYFSIYKGISDNIQQKKNDTEALTQLAQYSYLPKNKTLWTRQVVERGIFKFQDDYGLEYSGYLDFLTLKKLLSISEYDKVAKAHHRYRQHIPFPRGKSENIMEITPFIAAPEINLVKLSGEGVFSEKLQYGKYIFFNSGEMKRIPDYEKFGRYITEVLEQTSATEGMIVITVKDGNKEGIFFGFKKGSSFTGYVHSINDFGAQKIKIELQNAKEKNMKIIWAGDEISGADIRYMADQSQIPFIRRISEVNTVVNQIPSPQSFLNAKDASICIAIPYTEEQLRDMNGTSLGLKYWISAKKEIEGTIKGRFGRHLLDAEHLKEEIINGQNDFITIIAHADGSRFFINDKWISIEDIKTWVPRKEKINGNRTAVLFICEAANTKITSGLLFKKRVASLTELFLNKGYFTSVIAPYHEIRPSEVISILKRLILGKEIWNIRKKYRGWEIYGKINYLNSCKA